MFEYIRIRSFLPHDGVPDKFKRLCFTPPCVIYNHAGGTLITTNRMFDISKGVCSDIRRKNQKRKWSKFPTPISRAASRRISALCMSAVAVCILISVMVISCWCSSRTPGNHSSEIGVISYGDDEMTIKWHQLCSERGLAGACAPETRLTRPDGSRAPTRKDAVLSVSRAY